MASLRSVPRGLRLVLTTLLIALAASSGLTACHANTEAHAAYMCPMECEGNKTYDHPGKCPICGMDLVKVQQ